LTFQLAPTVRTILDRVDKYGDPVFSARMQSYLQGLEDIEAAKRNLPDNFQPQPTTPASTSTLTPAVTPAPAVAEGSLGPPAVDAVVMEESTTANIGELVLFNW
jgi:hypothetical protein